MLLRLFCFGVTYEGLKQLLDTKKFAELKKFWSYLWGFETGEYKEEAAENISVLELPMRVWN